MATAQLDTVIRQLRRAVLRQDEAGWTDGQLLASFIGRKDEGAFAALVRRHGPMVFGVCRRVVGNHHDAEDAFQATFLVLARKAPSVRPRERLANWLHGVALRTARKAQAMTAKRRGREKQVTDMPEPEAAQQDQWRDLQPLLDQELHGLPENYRLPILLCDLEGKTIKEATRQLGWPQGTLAGRLARGRKLLAKRLANRGALLSAGSLAAVVAPQAASAAVPAALIHSTVKAAARLAAEQATVAGVVPAEVALLTEGVLKAMLLSKLKAVAGALLAVGLLALAVRHGFSTASADQPPGQKPPARAAEAGPKKAPAPGKNLEGTWAVVSVEDNDKNQLDLDPIFSHVAGTQAPVRNARLTFRGGTFTLQTGLVSLGGSYSVAAPAALKEFTLSIATEAADGQGLISISGAYALDGDNLTISFGGLPASLVAGLAGKEPGVCYRLRRAPPAKREVDAKRADNGTATNAPGKPDASRSRAVPQPPQVEPQREYVIRSRLLEAGADQPREVLRLPQATVDEGQLAPLHLTDGPQNLLAKVIHDEKIQIGTFFDVRVKRLGGNAVRLFLSFQRKELEKSSVSEIRVLGQGVQAIQDVELHKPVKVVFQKDARGAAQRWVEITVDEITVDEPMLPPPAVSPPPQKGGRKGPERTTGARD
jgi:RNA polymerase sigma factor (sigma-70 family)